MGFTDENGFPLINEEQKIRITLSERAQITIAEDMAIFKTLKASSFINTVFSNYRLQAQSSISNYLQKQKIKLEQIFSDSELNLQSKQAAIEQLLYSEEKKLIEKSNRFLSLKGKSKLYHFNKANIEYLVDDCNEEKYYSRPGFYIRSVIEEYCALPFIDRERIYKQDIYAKIENACLKKQILKIKVTLSDPKQLSEQEQLFYVYPYRILPDPLHTQSYLVGYSRKAEENDGSKIIASFSMARLDHLTVLEQTFYLNKSEIARIEKQITKYSVAYLIGKPEQIKVKLTEEGKKIYRSKLSSRPEKIEALSTDDVYVFDCSLRQAFNYFFSFGRNAEILEPSELRNEFIENYSSALTAYHIPLFS